MTRPSGILGLSLLAGLACADYVPEPEQQQPQPPTLARIDLLPSSQTLFCGQRFQFQARGIDQFGAVMPGIAFEWRSSNATVASVEPNGTVTGRAAGSALISAQSGTVVGSASVLM